MKNAKNLAIIGGGASGLCAAISVKEINPDLTVTIYEKSIRVGKKLLATGNGRCNLTNKHIKIDNYHGSNPKFADFALEKYNASSTIGFFRKLGIVTIEDEDKIYPYSLQASSVLDCMRQRADVLGVITICECNIISVAKKNDGFIFSSESQNFYADKLIIAAGGLAATALGGCDGGYRLLKQLGHKITPTMAAIVQLQTDISHIKLLKGIKFYGRATTIINGKDVKSEDGEILFTEYGLSGPPILQISSLVSRAINRKEKVVICLDLVAQMDNKTLENLLFERVKILPTTSLENFLTGFLNKRLGQAIIKYANLMPLTRIAQSLTKNEIIQLSHAIKHFNISVNATNGLKNAQVTIGGADTSQFNSETMESRLINNLYACGEVLDIDGDCGGFNLQWAWSSGRLAALNAASK